MANKAACRLITANRIVAIAVRSRGRMSNHTVSPHNNRIHTRTKILSVPNEAKGIAADMRIAASSRPEI